MTTLWTDIVYLRSEWSFLFEQKTYYIILKTSLVSDLIIITIKQLGIVKAKDDVEYNAVVEEVAVIEENIIVYFLLYFRY